MGSSLIRENFSKMTKENHDEVVEKTKQQVLDMLKTTIRPEFLNRIDEITMFEPLREKEIEQVVRIQLNGVVSMLKENGVTLEFSEKAIHKIAEVGFDPEFGARPVKRAIQNMVLNTLSKQLLAGTVDKAIPISIDEKDGELVFNN